MADPDYEQYEKECAALRESNAILLSDFARKLEATGVTQKTVQKHVDNIKFYINDFLLYYEATNPVDGMLHIDSFLGDWFLRKAMWSSPDAVRGYAASFKKFYTFMHEAGHVSSEDLSELKAGIKACSPQWVANAERSW